MTNNQQYIFPGYLRSDGRKGIRNTLAIVYLVECAHHVAREISRSFSSNEVHLIGFPGCYPNPYADRVMNAVCTHPNVGAVLLVSLGCESFNRDRLRDNIEKTGRPVQLIGIQQSGGTQKTIAAGKSWVGETLTQLRQMATVAMTLKELMVGTICGGSDATSGITANPAVGLVFDRLVSAGSTCIFEETGEMIGLEDILMARTNDQALSKALRQSVEKAAIYYTKMGHGSFAPGNAAGGLTTIEEKSMGAYSKSGHAAISGLIKPGDIPAKGGLYLMDVVPDGEPKFGFPNINDNVEIVELIASGCHLILFTTGRGSVVGSAISPVIKICANPDTFAQMQEDMDINAGKVIKEGVNIADVADEIFHKIIAVARGEQSCSEALGHQEFILTYKEFQPAGPSCLPGF